jgi:hypothetical protein
MAQYGPSVSLVTNYTTAHQSARSVPIKAFWGWVKNQTFFLICAFAIFAPGEESANGLAASCPKLRRKWFFATAARAHPCIHSSPPIIIIEKRNSMGQSTKDQFVVLVEPSKEEQRAVLTERIRVLIQEHNAAEGSMRRILERQIEERGGECPILS